MPAFAISKRRRAEGGFNGADRILKALADGPARKLVGFTVDGKMPVREGAPIFAGDDQVGVMTSGGFAPSVGAPIAMGYVAAAHTPAGTALEAEVRGKRVAADRRCHALRSPSLSPQRRQPNEPLFHRRT